ncbi:MAG: hypothetical protein ACJ8F7_03960 [Gemmataceae bacterium]
MKPATENLRALIAVAAELRAGGIKWETVAEEVRRSVDTVRRWPVLYPAEWGACFRAAEGRLVAEAGAESLFFLRQLLRGKEEKYIFLAGQLLFKARQSERQAEQVASAPTGPTAQQVALVQELENMTDEELDYFLRQRITDEDRARVLKPETTVGPPPTES